jgi:hypothetical protein
MLSPCQLSKNEQANTFGNQHIWSGCRSMAGKPNPLQLVAPVFSRTKSSRANGDSLFFIE